MPAGISFLFCILIETQLTIDLSHYDYFLLRIVSGTLIGVIYLTSIIVCLQSGYTSTGTTTTTQTAYRSSATICGCLTIALIVLLSQTKISIELCCVSLTLIYSLIALNLSHSSWVFGDGGGSNSSSNNVDQQWQLRLQRRQEFCALAAADATTETVAVTVRPSNVRPFDAFNLVVGKQTRPLIYLAGAKLLTIFCFFLPFICIASQITIHANISFTDGVDVNKNNVNVLTSANKDDVSSSIIIGGGKIFTDFMVLLLTRIALGSIAILFVRHNVNFLSILYLIPITIGLAIMLLVPLLDLPWHSNTVQTITFSVVMVIYVAFSLIVDIIGHHAVLYANKMEIGHSHGATDAALKVISLTFATFIEHLIDICIVVVYLNDWISAKLIATSFAIIFLTMILSQTSANTNKRKQSNTNLITVKYQIL